MNRILYFKTVIIDSLPITEQKTVYSFFTENNEDDESVTSMSEDQAIRWLLNHPALRDSLLSEFFPDAFRIKCFFGVTKPFTSIGKMPGDIDVLLVDPMQPQKAVAFECKRVKSISIKDGESKLNNVEKIKKGIKQANQYQSLGFYKSYLMIILLDDGRKMDTPNVIFRYGRAENIGHMYDIPWQEPLNVDVGIIFVKVNQMTGKHINFSVSIGYCIEKEATPLEQTHEMTNKVRELLINLD